MLSRRRSSAIARTTLAAARTQQHRAMSTTIPYTLPLPGGIPDTHTPHTEQKTTILVPKENTAFLNPVQEYNRDLSVAVIRAWNEERKDKFNERERKKSERKTKANGVKAEAAKAEGDKVEGEAQPVAGPSTERVRRPRKITILEALSATGLRSIRYAKEIPDVKVVLANDLSASACEAMRQNVALNGVGEPAPVVEGETPAELPDLGRRENANGYVKVNEGDACTLMYMHRAPKDRVDVVDLDPYGTAAPFIDAAMGCIEDGGLLAVTCTDLAVLAGSNYPEKCFSNYGGVCANSEYSHEVALRLVLNSIAQAAARYGRAITPLVSFSIDFYVRLFIRIDTKPIEVKKLASQTGLAYVCRFCQTPVVQPFGRVVEKTSSKGNVNVNYRASVGPTGAQECAECGSPQNVAGPMWLDAIQDNEFAGRVLKSIENDKESYRTWPRMNGMLTMAQEELPNPFYFTSNRIFSFGHAIASPTKSLISALLNAGYKVSRSHALSGSIKTDAPHSFIFDMVREAVKVNPVRMDKVAENSPTRPLLAKAMTHTVDFTFHPDAKKFDPKAAAQKVVLYQENPLPNWGPGSRAKDTKTSKRKAEGEDEGVSAETDSTEPKRPKVEAPVEKHVDDEEAEMNA